MYGSERGRGKEARERVLEQIDEETFLLASCWRLGTLLGVSKSIVRATYSNIEPAQGGDGEREERKEGAGERPRSARTGLAGLPKGVSVLQSSARACVHLLERARTLGRARGSSRGGRSVRRAPCRLSSSRSTSSSPVDLPFRRASLERSDEG